MALARVVPVQTTATLIAGGSTSAGGLTITITNPSSLGAGISAPVFLSGDENGLGGTSTAASTTAFVLAPGQTFGPVRLGGQEKIYAMTSSVTTAVHVFNVGSAA